jgi:hypothetical protein
VSFGRLPEYGFTTGEAPTDAVWGYPNSFGRPHSMKGKALAALCIMFTVALGEPQPGGPAIGGRTWNSKVLQSLGMTTPASFGYLVRDARAALSPRAKACPVRVRKHQRVQRRMRASAEGGLFVKPETLRLCGASEDKALHIEQALAADFPVPSSRYELASDCVAAVQTMADMSGPDLSSWRKKQVGTLRRLAKKSRDLTSRIFEFHSDVPPSVKVLRRGINVAFIAILCEAIDWPDVDLCREITRGFRTAGDLRKQDSHVFRPADELAEVFGTHWEEVLAAPAGSVVRSHEGLQEALSSGQRVFSVDSLREWKISDIPANAVVFSGGSVFRPVTFDERWAAFSTESASKAWLHDCTQMLRRKALAAVELAAQGLDEDLDLLKAVSARTAEEVAIGHVGPAMTEETLIRKYSEDAGFLVRVAPRFGIWQGVKMIVDELGAETPKLDSHGMPIWKLRCIDDFKVNGVNGVTWLSEHLVMPNFEFPAKIAAEFAKALDEQAADSPGLLLGLDDLFAAYRRIPNADSRRFGIVGVYDFNADGGKGAVVWHEVLGLPFGLSSAPIIFNRVPALLCVFARAWCAVAVDQFVDDYMTVDRDDSPIETETVEGVGGKRRRSTRLWSSSGQWALSEIHSMAGLELEPEKRKPGAHVNVLLGVEGDLRDFRQKRQVRFRPTRRRCKAILASFKECRRRGRMKPREAANLLGRLTFILSSAYTSVGRAATQPLVDRAADKAGGKGAGRRQRHAWTASMSHMLAFFTALFKEVPDLVFDFRKRPKAKVVIYTDASFSEDRNGLGFIVFDQETQQRFVCDARCPSDLMEVWGAKGSNPWLLRELAGDHSQETHINSLELLAILAVVWTVGPAMLEDREVLFFCDNTSAMSAAVHGYARSSHMGALSNALHLALASLRCDAWFEWVPSEANCADIPSRPQGPAEQQFYEDQKLERWPGGMLFPPIHQIREPRLHDVRGRR